MGGDGGLIAFTSSMKQESILSSDWEQEMGRCWRIEERWKSVK